MLVFLFRADGRVFGVTADVAGANLPNGYGEWSALKSIELERGRAQPGLDADECLDDIGRFGFHLTDAHVRITEQAVG